MNIMNYEKEQGALYYEKEKNRKSKFIKCCPVGRD